MFALKTLQLTTSSGSKIWNLSSRRNIFYHKNNVLLRPNVTSTALFPKPASNVHVRSIKTTKKDEKSQNAHSVKKEKTTEVKKPVQKKTSTPSDPFQKISAQLVEQCKKDIKFISEEMSTSIHGQIARKFLDQSGFKVMAMEEGELVYGKNDGKHEVKIKIPSQLEDEEGAEDEMAEGEQGEDQYYDGQEREEDEEEEGEEGRQGRIIDHNENKDEEVEEGEEGLYPGREGEGVPDEFFPETHPFSIEVSFLNEKGDSKGKWLISAVATPENELELMNIECYNSEQLKNLEESQMHPLYFESLSTEMQDSILHYLHMLGVTNEVAHFAKQAVMEHHSASDMKFLQNLADLMKH